MKINEYKNEVNSLTLSNEFKQELKEKLIAAADSSPASKPAIKKSAALFTTKYSRYIALAACLLLVISTVSIVSIGGLKSKLMDPANDSSAVGDEINEKNDEQPAESTDHDDASYDDDDVAEPTMAVDYPDEPVDNAEDNSAIDTTTDNSLDEEPIVEEQTPRTGNGYSSYASPEYAGSYNGEDYIIANNIGSASNTADHVAEYFNINANYVVMPKAEQKIEYGDHEPHVESTGNDTPTSSVDDDEEDIEENYHDSNPAANAPSAEDMTFEELTGGWSYSYYGLRDGVIANLDGIAFIRFNIENAYDVFEAANNISSPVTMDPYLQTLYDINISYDYFENDSVDVDRLMLNAGTKDWQLIGRPLMEGEYIALVTENDEGVLEPVSQLVYAVHKVNGLDIAYHVYSDDGFMIDPDNSNMGLMPEEREVITSTKNNPEIYTQKASVRELTYYIRRNLLRLNPTLIDLNGGSVKKDDTPEDNTPAQDDNGAVPEEIKYRSTIRANFPTGSLKLTMNSISIYAGNFSASDEYPVKVNGIGIGDDMQKALKAFYLSDYYFTHDAQITLIASEEDGGWWVTVKFSDNIVTEISVRT